jgi:predicted Rdx family selenoprotein
LKKEFDAEIKLIASSGGVFEVVADTELLFSKKKLQRFPEDGEIGMLIKAGGTDGRRAFIFE